uniref:PAR1 protein n=1 Tax=Noccaea caerulescens TaxID=107243 RepID=A0A1J3DFK1_NOCCA
MSYSSLKLPIFLILSSLLHVALGEEIVCENLPTNMCAFSISASGKRCLLETANVAGEYTCRTSTVEVDGIVNHVESDECVAACGVDRKTVGISSDSMMEAGFASKLCSPACLDFCPNILDLYFNLAAGEGAFLPDLCDAQRINPHRSMLEILSSGAAPGPVSDTAPGPVSVSNVLSPALAPAAM